MVEKDLKMAQKRFLSVVIEIETEEYLCQEGHWNQRFEGVAGHSGVGGTRMQEKSARTACSE
jgi:hypothetical protein